MRKFLSGVETTGLKVTTSPTSGYVLTSDASGVASWAPAPGAGSGITRIISSISSPTTAGAVAAKDYVYLISGDTTLTLPTAVGNTNQYTAKNAGTGTVTVATTSSQTIDGGTTATLTQSNESVTMVSNGTNWYII